MWGLSSPSHILSRHSCLWEPAPLPLHLAPHSPTCGARPRDLSSVLSHGYGRTVAAAEQSLSQRSMCRASQPGVPLRPAATTVLLTFPPTLPCRAFPPSLLHKHQAPSTGMPFHSLQAPRPRLSDLNLATALRGRHLDLILWRRKQLEKQGTRPRSHSYE